MKRAIGVIFSVLLAGLFLSACDDPRPQTSDTIQRQQQERMLQESTSAVGMPGIKNFREKRMLKMIMELCDQEGIVTYTYMENMVPTIIRGKTALGGKLTYVGETIGYGIPFATQYSNPQKIEASGVNYGYAILAQADPNGLFKPASADGTWILMKDPNSGKVSPQFIEPRLCTFTFKFPVD